MNFGLIKQSNSSETAAMNLISRFKNNGISFSHIFDCDDTADALKSCIISAISQCDVVLLVMPLSPKSQARSILADALGLPMEYSKRALKHLQSHFDPSVDQSEEYSDCAWLPAGARVLLGSNPIPACACLTDDKVVFLIDTKSDDKITDSVLGFAISIKTAQEQPNDEHEYFHIDTPVIQTTLSPHNTHFSNSSSDIKSKEPRGTPATISMDDDFPKNVLTPYLRQRRLKKAMPAILFLFSLILIALAGNNLLERPALQYSPAISGDGENKASISEPPTVRMENSVLAELSKAEPATPAQPKPKPSEASSPNPVSSAIQPTTPLSSSAKPSLPSVSPPQSSSSIVSSPVVTEPIEIIEISGPAIKDDRTVDTPASSSPITSSSSDTVTGYSRISSSQTQIPKAEINKKLNFTANGSRRSMDAYDLVCAIVQNETNGILDGEALKAQAVASYTYVLHHNAAGTAPNVGINTAISQTVKAAVSAVFGQTIRYQGGLINATYHSTSSGKTTSAESVWGSDIPYLVSVDSSLDRKAPKYQQTVQIDANEFARLVFSVYNITLDGDPSSWIQAKRDAPGGYVGSVVIGGFSVSQGGKYGNGKPITGRSVRESLMNFSIRSHCFDVLYVSDRDAFLFTTYGYGHGVGMSQYGAHFMALEGNSYLDILSHYYPGTTVS